MADDSRDGGGRAALGTAAEPTVVVFAYHDVGYVCLEELLRRGARVVALITHEDDPKENRWFRSVTELAQKHGIPVYKPDSVNNEEWLLRIRALRPEVIFSFYYRHLIPEAILKLPHLGAFNLHGSLLPKYRGRVPINWAIIHGETRTGVTLHWMVAKPDAGDIVDQEAVPIGPMETAREVFDRVAAAARQVVARQWDNIKSGKAPHIPQDPAQASYYGGRKPEDGRIDWRQGAREIFNLVRAVTHPYPGAFTALDGRRLFIWWALPRRENTGSQPGEVISTAPLHIATGQGSLEVLRLQWADGEEQDAATVGLKAGQRFDSLPG
ncbi:MAG: formyltransferase [Gammaproteobacteria bacterium]|nr:formyltransferase [Gammaproteobacteria bacterium]